MYNYDRYGLKIEHHETKKMTMTVTLMNHVRRLSNNRYNGEDLAHFFKLQPQDSIFMQNIVDDLSVQLEYLINTNIKVQNTVKGKMFDWKQHTYCTHY